MEVMARSRKLRLKFWVLGIALAVGISGMLCSYKPWIKSCLRFDPVYWEGTQSFLGVRTESDGNLLLASFGDDLFYEKESATPNRTIYRWTLGADQLAVASKEDWNLAAQGEISQRSKFGLDPHDHALVFNGETVRTAGKTVDMWSPSPSGRFVAVASTDARWIGGMWFGLGGGLQSTLWFHQVFDEQTGKQVGKTLALRSDRKMWRPEIGWSSDSKYVIYLGQDSRWVWIAPLEAQ